MFKESSFLRIKKINPHHYKNSVHKELISHINLYRSVINQAFTDLSSNSKKLAARRNRIRARMFFFGNSQNLEYICTIAAINSKEVVRLAKDIIANRL